MTRPRLSPATLDRLPPEVARPGYDRGAIATGIVHFGPGAFHRVHQAWYVERLLPRDPRWGICAVSLRSADLHEALAPQDGLYTLAVRDACCSHQVVGALRESLVAPRDPAAVLSRLAAPTTHAITLTVTEKGYCLGPDGTLDLARADIGHDLATPHAPVTAIGYLVEGLARRRAAGTAPPAILCCDNLADNGPRLRAAVLALARERDRGLADWIAAAVAFPRSMVDSITQATTDALRAEVAAATGLDDRWPVQREAFVQWVLERHAAPVMPDWAAAGVVLTDDVPAWERAKLRLLNAAHSTLAYAGLLAGHATVAEAIADPALAGFVERLWTREVMPGLAAPQGLDLGAYAAAVLERFRNPVIRHQLAQIAWDGSQKLPVRILGTVADNLAAARPVSRLLLPVAAWLHFVRRVATAGGRLVDPLAPDLLAVGAAATGTAREDLQSWLAPGGAFPPPLAADPRFAQALALAYDRLSAALSSGTDAVVAAIADWN